MLVNHRKNYLKSENLILGEFPEDQWPHPGDNISKDIVPNPDDGFSEDGAVYPGEKVFMERYPKTKDDFFF